MFEPGKRKESNRILRVGLGAGLVGGVLIALRYAARPSTRKPLPDAISPAIFATRAIQTSKGQIVYHTSGSGKPLVFLHSVCVGASSYEWSKVYPSFASTHRVIAPDLIGFGESERPRGPMTAADQVESLADLIRATCGGSPPILVGSGLGGGFAVLLATQHPELVSRLVLLMPTGLTEFGRSRLTLRAGLIARLPGLNRFTYRNYLSLRGTLHAWLCRFGFANPDLVTSEMVDVFATCAQQYGAEHAVYNLMAGRFNFDLEGRLNELTQPVRLVWGESAVFPPREWAERFRQRVAASSLTILHQAGTLAALEVPDALRDVLADELEGDLRVFKAG